MKTGLLVLFLFGLLAFVVWWVSDIYNTIGGFEMPVAGWVALFLGVILSVVIGVGLMILVFYSNRHGYDERSQYHEQ